MGERCVEVFPTARIVDENHRRYRGATKGVERAVAIGERLGRA
jgi:hypothetical protein